MLKLILFLLSALLLIIVRADNTEIQRNSIEAKSFTAHCQTSQTCDYSLVLSTSGSSFGATVTVQVDSNVGSPTTVSVKSSEPATIKITVNDSSKITIYIDSTTSPSSAMLFTVYDSEGNAIADSKQLVMRVLNDCQTETCDFSFHRSEFWTTGLVALFRVNFTVQATLDDNSPWDIPVTVGPYDSLIVEIVPDPNEAPVPDGITVTVLYGQSVALYWYSNFYYTPMITFSNGCGNPPPPPEPITSPFGGYLYQIKQKQIEEFLASIGTSYSTLWYRITKNES